ncbi:MAG TPA: thiamine-phosphate kinase [Solirubrobacterales bacterium]
MGEFELLARIRERLPPAGTQIRIGMGDDAAVTVPGGATATSVDAIVDGVHFRREHYSLAQVGHKALATALSDLAAMGAGPGEAYTVLGVPPDLDEDGCLELFDGIVSLAAETGTTLAGGDVTRAPALTVAMTVVGHAPSAEALVTRAGARPGDVVVVTGELGAAAAGLLLFEHPDLPGAVSAEVGEQLKKRQREPQPRLRAGRALALAGATAMIDLSDGLGADAAHLSAQSGVELRLAAGSLPLAEGVAEVAEAAGVDTARLTVCGGEDYELLATLPPSRLRAALAAVAETDTTMVTVGEVADGAGVDVRLPDGRTLDPGGFDQLS